MMFCHLLMSSAATTISPTGRALGTSGAIVGAGLMSGPVLGGLLLDTFGWRAIFWPQLPVSAAGALLAWRLLREQRPAVAERRIDLPGAVLLFAALASFVLAINRGGDWGWLSARILGLALLSLGALAALLRVERRSRSPIIDLNLFRNRLFAAATLSLLFFFSATAGVTLLMPFYLTRVRHYDALRAGSALIAVPVVMLVFSPLTGWLTDRYGSRLLATGGMGMVVVALASLLTLDQRTPMAAVMARLALLGVGNALFQSPNSSTIMGAAPRTHLGAAAAMNATGRSIGQAMGFALAGAIFVDRAAAQAGIAAGDRLRVERLPGGALLSGIQAALVAALVIAFAGMGAAFIRGGARQGAADGEEDERRAEPRPALALGE